MADNKVIIQDSEGREIKIAVDAPVRVEGQFVCAGTLKPGTKFEACWGASWEPCTVLASERVAVTYVVTGTPRNLNETLAAIDRGIGCWGQRAYVGQPVISKL